MESFHWCPYYLPRVDGTRQLLGLGSRYTLGGKWYRGWFGVDIPGCESIYSEDEDLPELITDLADKIIHTYQRAMVLHMASVAHDGMNLGIPDTSSVSMQIYSYIGASETEMDAPMLLLEELGRRSFQPFQLLPPLEECTWFGGSIRTVRLLDDGNTLPLELDRYSEIDMDGLDLLCPELSHIWELEESVPRALRLACCIHRQKLGETMPPRSPLAIALEWVTSLPVASPRLDRAPPSWGRPITVKGGRRGERLYHLGSQGLLAKVAADGVPSSGLPLQRVHARLSGSEEEGETYLVTLPLSWAMEASRYLQVQAKSLVDETSIGTYIAAPPSELPDDVLWTTMEMKLTAFPTPGTRVETPTFVTSVPRVTYYYLVCGVLTLILERLEEEHLPEDTRVLSIDHRGVLLQMKGELTEEDLHHPWVVREEQNYYGRARNKPWWC